MNALTGLLLQLSTPATADAATIIATARLMTAAEYRCAIDPNSTDITVCGLRHADRFRVPFTGYAPGDPRGEAPMAERERMMRGRPIPCGQGAFTTQCGMVGATVSSAQGFVPGGERPMAP